MTAPTLSDSLRERLLKTLRLANQGIGGERDNAETILEKLLRQHGLTRADLEEIDTPLRATVWFPVPVADRTVFRGLVHALFTNDRTVWCVRSGRGKNTERGVDLSAAEKVTFTLAWEVYQNAWHRVAEDIEIAFLRKHKLYDTTGKPAYLEDLTPEEIADYKRRQALVHSLEDIAKPGAKRLTSTSAEG